MRECGQRGDVAEERPLAVTKPGKAEGAIVADLPEQGTHQDRDVHQPIAILPSVEHCNDAAKALRAGDVVVTGGAVELA